MTILLVCSELPSIWGWNTVESFSLTPERLWSTDQNAEVNSLSQLEMMRKGKLFSQYQLLKNSTANSLVIISVRVAQTHRSAPSGSVAMQMASKPQSGGSGPTKLIVTNSAFFRDGQGVEWPCGPRGG